MTRLISSILCFVLLSAGSFGLVGHDHGLESRSAEISCNGDHQAGQTSSPSPTSELARAASQHEHDCIGCHLSRSRCGTIALVASSEAGTGEEAAWLWEGCQCPRPALQSNASERGPPVTTLT